MPVMCHAWQIRAHSCDTQRFGLVLWSEGIGADRAPAALQLLDATRPTSVQIVQIALELNGAIKVVPADSGEQALEFARSQRPDLILLDVLMPGIDGPTILKRMRTDPARARIPVAFITAKAFPHEVAGLRELGSIGVIAKPFDPMALESHVQTIWNGRGELDTATKQDLPDQVEDEVKALSMRELVQRSDGCCVSL
jgi:two-component system, OmpR family, response regulator